MSCSSTMDRAAEAVWARFETILRTLYLEQDLNLAEVMNEMAMKHQFNATKSQYELQFKKWQFRKYRTAEEWKIVAHKLTERKKYHKDSEVVLNGNVINPKKLRKEILRYGSISTAIEILPPGPSPPTPEGFIIRTPSPKFTTSAATSTEFRYVHPAVNIGPLLMDRLPFHEFNSVFGNAENPFLCIPENSASGLVALSQDVHSSVLGQLTGMDGKKVSGPFSEIIEALLPENVFPSNPTTVNMAISQRQPSSILRFLKLTMYLVSNNFFGSTTDISRKVYQWIKRRSNAGLMEYLLSIGGPTVEALTENLFRLAIDAEDVRTTKEMLKLGINPNEQVYRNTSGDCCTALKKACEMQNLKLVRALIDGGAKVDFSVGNNDVESVLMAAVDGFGDDYKRRAHMDPEIVQILLDAGAAVNPGLGRSPLANAVEWGHVEVVRLLVSAGADVNIITDDGEYAATPLVRAVDCDDRIPDTDAISMARNLLNAGADPRGVSIFDGEATTALEVAMGRKNIELIQLLLENGARVDEPSFVNAVRCCDIDVVTLLLKFGGQVTEPVIECAVENNSTLVVFLLETADDRIKKRCKTAALIKSIECRKMDLIHRLGAFGAQLKKDSKLTGAIREVIRVGDTDVLRFLLDEKSEYRILSLESLDTMLWTAITNGRNDIAELLLMAGANVNSSDHSMKESPLLAAIRKKDLHLTRQLLVAGAAVNGRDMNGHAWYSTATITTTVLPAVVDWGYYPLIRDIINAGAEIDAPEKINGKTALFVAVEKKDTKSIKLLIDAGANVNTPGAAFSGQTALKAASQNNDLQMVQYLLGLGADPDEWSLMAAISGSLELVQTLLGARLHRYKRYSQGYGCAALQHAIRLKNATMIKVLLARKIDANAIIRENFGDKAYRFPKTSRELCLTPGESALGSAIKRDKSMDSWIVRLLLGGGADPNSVVTDDHQTALLVAIDENNLALVKVLIAAGADANPKFRSGVRRTPLQLAVEKGRIDIVNILLDNGADINAPPFDRYGATALQFAAIGGYIRIAQPLIQRGADVNASSAKIGGRTAIEGAAEHGRIDMLQLLLDAGAQISGTGRAQYDRARELALENGHRAACQLLEKYSTNMSEKLVSLDNMWMDSSSSAQWDDSLFDLSSFAPCDDTLLDLSPFPPWDDTLLDLSSFEEGLSF